ncbi:MAG TPA: xanthine dehydrogenase family protein subunit M [Syntrophorhabdaceae bacterium]|nr:xanthine dehydrogenase family protein subunit M [Syntrophorhabdaceae bacterium]HNT69674.1 xanthine dehydrogenase family protein subunit M [Syntrophorhabdaceae bacterium]
MFILPKFVFHEPRDISEACKMISELNGSSKIIAGGTDILVNMKKGLLSPKYLVSVAKIAGMSEIEPGSGTISIGAHLIVAKLAEFDIIRTKLPSLAKAASVLGSPLIRNRATIGGNIVTARPAADLPPPLLAMGAKVKLESAKGAREVALDDFFTGPGATVMKPDEILSRVIVDEMPPFTGSDYIKLGHRKALEIAIVAVASRVTLDGPDGKIKEARVILSSVAPKAIHAVSAEKALIGEKPTEALVKKAAQLAGTDCSPITDIRGGAGYRCAMVEALTKRTLLAAIKEAQGK